MYFKGGLGDVGEFFLCRNRVGFSVPMSQPEEPREPPVGVQEPSASNLEQLGILSC